MACDTLPMVRHSCCCGDRLTDVDLRGCGDDTAVAVLIPNPINREILIIWSQTAVRQRTEKQK